MLNVTSEMPLNGYSTFSLTVSAMTSIFCHMTILILQIHGNLIQIFSLGSKEQPAFSFKIIFRMTA